MKKVLATFLLFTLLVSVGTIYASNNSAHNLSDWYKGSFQKVSEELGATTATGMISIFKKVNTFRADSRVSIDTAIATFSSSQVKDAKSSIEKKRADTIKSLNHTVAELENVNFDEYVDELNIEAEIEQDFEQMVEEVFNE